MVTLVAAIGAVILYFVQAADARDAEMRTNTSLVRLQATLDGVNKTATPLQAVDRTPAAEEDPVNLSPPKDKIKQRLQSGSRRLLVYDKDALPIRVLADIVLYWRDREEKGRWRLDRIAAVARRPGRGNLPWIVIFSASDKSDPDLIALSVTYPPRRSKERGSVDEIQLTVPPE